MSAASIAAAAVTPASAVSSSSFLPAGVVSFLSSINGSRLAWGAASIAFNLGSRFLLMDLTPNQMRMVSHPFFKRLVAFCMFFVTTRDILLSVCFGAVLLSILEVFTNENSKFCIMPGGHCKANPLLLSPAMPTAVAGNMASNILGRAIGTRLNHHVPNQYPNQSAVASQPATQLAVTYQQQQPRQPPLPPPPTAGMLVSANSSNQHVIQVVQREYPSASSFWGPFAE